MNQLPPLGGKGSESKAQIYTIGAARAIAAAFPQIRSIGMWRPPDGYNEHSGGVAADVMIPGWDTPGGRALGDEVCRYALTLQGVDYVIWRQAMHYRSGKVTPMSDRGSPTQNHMDHNHVHTTGGGYPAPEQTYTAAGVAGVAAAPASYGMPTGSNSGGYGGGGVKFPDWVYQLGNAFGVKPSTYPGHQESDRREAGYAPNPQHLNRGIDWAAPGDPTEIEKLTRFADYLATIPQELEQVIWQNPRTMRSIEIAGGRHQPGYFRSDLAGHRNHVHTRQSHSLPLPGGPPPPPPPLSRADRYALDIIREGQRLGVTPRGLKIALSVGLVESGLKNYANSNDPPSLLIPHDAVGSDHDSLGWAQQRPAWGSRECRMNITCAAKLFFTVDNGPGVRGLTKIRDRDGNPYDYNDTSRTPGFYAQKVQGSAFPDRYDQRFGEAEQIYNRLLLLPGGEDDMALVPQHQWDALYNAVMNQRPSRSPLREPGEGSVGDMPDQIWDMDGSLHILVVYLLASLGHPGQLALLRRVAATKEPGREADAELANNILADLADSGGVAGKPSTATVVRVTPAAMPVTTSTGTTISHYETEVLPAVREPTTANTPEELLNTMQRLRAFNEAYRKGFSELTEKPEEQ